jgi:hypothetical protein
MLNFLAAVLMRKVLKRWVAREEKQASGSANIIKRGFFKMNNELN